MSLRQDLIANGTIKPSCVMGKTAKARAAKLVAAAAKRARDKLEALVKGNKK